MAVRERFTTTIDGQLLEDVRILAIKKRCSTNDLIEEAITDLLKKYQEKQQSGEKAEPAKD
jgi:metal-responsive CopG/Arc/MetJ family transcriptional regulator